MEFQGKDNIPSPRYYFSKFRSVLSTIKYPGSLSVATE